jgi:hypothetical protein
MRMSFISFRMKRRSGDYKNHASAWLHENILSPEEKKTIYSAVTFLMKERLIFFNAKLAVWPAVTDLTGTRLV